MIFLQQSLKRMTEKIKGLKIIELFITSEQERNLVKFLEAQNWSSEIRRKTLHYGKRYCYKTKKLINDVEPIPEELYELIEAVEDQVCSKTTSFKINQCIVNKYEAGEGIGAHIDHKTLFSGIIVTVSLLSDCVITFVKEKESVSVPAQRRSCIILEKEARYDWTHALKCSEKRISITFRQIS